MATDTAAAPVTRPAPPRRLWQVPTFIVGAAVFAAAYQGLIPVGPPSPDAAFLADLAALTAATERLSPVVEELRTALPRVVREAEKYPEHGPAAHLALGSGYARLAEITPEPGEARGYWVLSRQHFTAVDESRVAEPDRPKFIFRRAKALAADLPATLSPADAELLRAVLSRPPIGEDPGDAPRLVAELSLRVSPPDLRRAKEGFTSYLTNTALGTPSAPLARAKLRLSEVCLKLNEPDGAKQWLGAIGPDAPSDVLAVAKGQLGHIRMAERDWAGAARDWEAARSAPDLPPALRAAAAYYLAECRLHAKPGDPDAARLLEEAVKGASPEASFAAVRLAEISLKSPEAARHKAAVGYLTTAARGVKGPADLAVVPPGAPTAVEFQAAFEQAVQVLSADGAFPEAVAAADAYAPFAAGGKDREKKADVYTAWGAALEKAGADGKARFAAAAEEYTALATARPDDAYKAEQLRRSAALYRRAGDAATGLAALERAIAVPRLPDEVAGPVWADYADGLLAANRPADALGAFTKAMATSGPASTISRHKLARNLIDSGNKDKVPLGVELLKQIASAERVSPAEQETHEWALYELGNEAFRVRNLPEAETRLRTQLRLYPSGSENAQGKVLLGAVLMQRINPKAKMLGAEEEKAGEEALGLFKQVLADVEGRKVANRPGPADAWLRDQANTHQLLAYLLLRKPYDVLHTADPLRRQYAGRVEELIVLSMMFHAYRQLGNENGQLTIDSNMREAFAQLKDKPGAFPNTSGEYSREYWERDWRLAGSTPPAATPPAAPR